MDFFRGGVTFKLHVDATTKKEDTKLLSADQQPWIMATVLSE